MVENHGEDYKVRPPGKNHLGLLGKYTGLFQPDLRWNRRREESTEESIPVFTDFYVYECFAPCMCITCVPGTCGSQKKVLDPL